MGMARPPRRASGARPTPATWPAQRRAADIAGGLGAVSKVAAHDAAVGGARRRRLSRDPAARRRPASSSRARSSRRARWRRSSSPSPTGRASSRPARAGSGCSSCCALLPAEQQPTPLPRRAQALAVEAVGVAPPGEQRVVVQDVTFALKAGQGLGIIGPSASGKSSLARALVGVWPPARGKVRLDGAALDQWCAEALGRHIGYLPQDVELFAGTVAQNIARFEPEPDPEAMIAAAQAAGVHELILRLPDGYETQIGEGGAALSAGQRQRIALARALYRRSVPGRARRAQLQPRRRGRAGADAGDPGRARARRHRHRRRAPAERACRRRPAARAWPRAACRPSGPRTRCWQDCMQAAGRGAGCRSSVVAEGGERA